MKTNLFEKDTILTEEGVDTLISQIEKAKVSPKRITKIDIEENIKEGRRLLVSLMRFYRKDDYITLVSYKSRKIILVTQFKFTDKDDIKLLKDNLKIILDKNEEVKYVIAAGHLYNLKFLFTKDKDQFTRWLTPTLFGSLNHINKAILEEVIEK